MTPQLAASVAALPSTANDAAYADFIRRFGTHYANAVSMGAKFFYQSEVSCFSPLNVAVSLEWNFQICRNLIRVELLAPILKLYTSNLLPWVRLQPIDTLKVASGVNTMQDGSTYPKCELSRWS